MRLAIRAAIVAAVAASIVLAGGHTARAVNLPPIGANTCTAGKIKCADKKKRCLLGCEARARLSGLAVDAGCVQRCRDKFDGGSAPSKGCFAKLEAKGGCATTGDAAAIECKIDAFVQDVVAELDPNPADDLNKCTAAKLKCVTKYDKCILGLFAKQASKGVPIDAAKLAHCQSVLAGTKSCFDKAEAGAGCLTTLDQVAIAGKDDAFIDDLVAELVQGRSDMHDQRCLNDTSIKCANDGDCSSVGGTCEFWFGSNLPRAGGGVSICLTNQWDGPIVGTIDTGTGASAWSGTLITRIYAAILNTEPCPQCVGDIFQNDGVQAGTCDGGSRNGLPCDSNGTHPYPSFGETSMDCPPTPGALIDALTIDLDNTNNGVSALVLSAASPDCRAPGFTSLKCACDVCSGDDERPCRSDADCVGFGSCGIGVTLTKTAPNSCMGGICDLDLGNGEGACGMGPLDQVCALEPFRGCTVPTQATDCPAPGDYCTAPPRKCFLDNGVIGNAIVAEGDHSAPVDHWSRSTFAATYCIAGTASKAVNDAVGLPGPGRRAVGGVLTDNGTNDPASCPTQVSFTPTTRKGVLDAGWTGIAHDAQVVSNSMVTFGVTGCSGSAPGCGVCSFSGPVLNPKAVP